MIIQLNIFVPAIHRQNAKGVVLTFDDGPDPQYTAEVLRVLAEHNAKATFFLIGHKAEAHQDVVKRIVDAGHRIGSHSYSHSYQLGFFSLPKLRDDLSRGHEAVEQAAGQPSTLYRPPMGVTNPRIARVVREREWTVLGWSLRSLDTVIKSPERLVNRVVRKAKAGDIILFHDNRAITAQCLPEIIKGIRKKGLDIDNLDHLHA